MKKTVCALMAVLLLTGCAKGSSAAQSSEIKPDSSASPADSSYNVVELEYTLNEMKGYIWAEQPAAEFREVTWGEAMRLFQEKGTGLLLFGYENCNYCQRAVPLLSEAAKEQNRPVYYIDVYAEPQPTEEEFKTMCQYIAETMEWDENGEPEFFVPIVIGIRNGEITGYHVSLVDGFTPKDTSDQLTDEQKERLKNIYLEIMEKTF